MMLEEFVTQIKQQTEQFMAEWKSHKGDPAWPNEMEKGDWLEHLMFTIAEYDQERERMI